MIELPPELRNVDVMEATSYRREPHVTQLKISSKKFSDLGLITFPPPDVVFRMRTRGFPVPHDDDDSLPLARLERFFFEGVRRSRLLYGIPAEGYLGYSAAIEIAYGLAIKKLTVLSEEITTFGDDVPKGLQNVLLKYHPQIVPIETLSPETLNLNQDLSNLPDLTREELIEIRKSGRRLRDSWY